MHSMRICSIAGMLMCQLTAATVPGSSGASAQTQIQTLAIKNGESVPVHPIYWTVNCRSTMIGLPEIEILEGPPALALTIKQDMVLPRAQNCAAKVPGGTLIATATNVAERTEAKLTYRIKYKTRDGDRQTARTYNLVLFP